MSDQPGMFSGLSAGWKCSVPKLSVHAVSSAELSIALFNILAQQARMAAKSSVDASRYVLNINVVTLSSGPRLPTTWKAAKD